jgi:membrane protein DedA with SNARE-associated domain
VNSNTVLQEFARFGYFAVFVPIAAESAGVPLPGETALLAAGFLAHAGRLDIRWVIAVASAAAIVGDNVGYLIGRTGGRALVLRAGRFLFITPERLDAAERFFAAHGGKAVFLARWTTGLRIAGAWAAGASRMPWGTFLLWNAVGGILWALSIGLVGYFAGSAYERAANVIGIGGAIVFGLVVLAGVVMWRRRRRAARD